MRRLNRPRLAHLHSPPNVKQLLIAPFLRSDFPRNLGFIFGMALALRDCLLLYLQGPNVTSDSIAFVVFGRMLRDLSVTVPPYLRTPPYLIMNALTFSDQSLYPLLLAQVCLAAFAGGILVYVLSLRNPIPALCVGVFLLLDFVWGAEERFVLLEGPLESFQLIALALVIYIYERRTTVGFAKLALIGGILAWCLVIRQTNIVLLAAVPVLALGVMRSAKRAGAVTLGILAVIAGMVCLNAWRTSQLGLWAEGGWYAEFPMFTHGLFRPGNGPASERLASHLQHCGIPYGDIRMPGGTVNQWQLESCLKREEALWIIEHERAAAPGFLTTDTVACLDRMGGRPSRDQAIRCVDDTYNDAIERCLRIQDWYDSQRCIYASTNNALPQRVSGLISRAYYKETLPANITHLAGVVAPELWRFFATDLSKQVGLFWLLPLRSSIPERACRFVWCPPVNFEARWPFSESTITRIETATSFSQVYFRIYRSVLPTAATGWGPAAVWLALSVFTFAMTRGAVRFASMLIFVLVLNTGLMTVLANIVIPRYVSPVSAFYACQSGLFVFAVFVGMKRLFEAASMSLRAGQQKGETSAR